MLPAIQGLLKPGTARPIFLMMSIGNPGVLGDTRHSVGHMALSALQLTLDDQPAFRRRQYTNASKNGPLTSLSAWEDYTLLKSPTLMNVSGKWAKGVVEAACERHPRNPILAIVVHDEMELPFGQVKVREWAQSPKGHNGIKSCKAYIGEPRGHNGYYRIGIGIDRPMSREREIVANYVLSPLSPDQRRKIDNIGPKIVQKMEEIAKRWSEAQSTLSS